MNECKMKFSEAIRKGCKIAPHKTIGRYYSKNKKSACAYGAAMLACGYGLDTLEEYSFGELFGYDESATYIHPVGGKKWQLFTIVTWLNDTLNWKRERIADWLEEQGL